MCEKLTFYRPVFPDTDRLQHEKLKNAMFYWDGGVGHLQHRTHDMAESVRDSAPEVSRFLDELNQYFRDLEKLLRDTYPEAPRGH